MQQRRENKNGRIDFMHLHWPKNEYFFQAGPKIISLRKCPDFPSFVYFEDECYVMLLANVIKTKRWDMKFLTGIFNSRLIAFWLKYNKKPQGNVLQVDAGPLMSIPLPIFDSIDKAKVSKMISLVDDIINKKQNGQDSSSEEKIVDELVYDIYGLTHDEIQIIESNV
jgi:adenine-specific DNA-methyltransferase